MDETSPAVDRRSTVRSLDPRAASIGPTGFIVVRLSRQYANLMGSTLLEIAGCHADLDPLVQFLRSAHLLESMRSVMSVPIDRILSWEQAAADTALAPIRSLAQYWRVDARATSSDNPNESLERLVAAIAGVHGIEAAYVEHGAAPSTYQILHTDDQDYFPRQTYLEAPDDASHPTRAGGVNAVALWELGIYGEGVGFVDVEHAWYLDHKDLKRRNVQTIASNGSSVLGTSGDSVEESFVRHGTAVLGVVAAVNDGKGIVGMAPRLKSVTVASTVGPDDKPLVANAIVNAIDATAPGDVILVEMESKVISGAHWAWYPPEEADEVFDAIRLASALGRVVVEPAGNGGDAGTGLDLDDFVRNGTHVFSRDPARESGAIMVAGSKAKPPYKATEESNYGSRIDCFAPGEKVVTCYYTRQANADPSAYQDDFDGTSAASAIVAGAAVLLQSAWKKRTGNVLSPLDLRALLSGPGNRPHGGSKSIGVMPDLAAIVDSRLPDVYLRDTANDKGKIPATGAIGASPDIIVCASEVGDPDRAFGAGSGTERDVHLSDTVTPGVDHYLYARLHNRGSVEAQASTVTFYWTQLSTIVPLDDWHLIGTTPPFDVPAGDTIAVSTSVTWRGEDIPPSGAYCLIAVANNAMDLAPPVPMLADAREPGAFADTIRNNNNVAWRSVNVVEYSNESADPIVLPFALAGAPHNSREFDLEIKVPAIPASRVTLHVPHSVAVQLDPGQASNEIELTGTAGLSPRTVALPSGVRYACKIRLEPPFGTLRGRKQLVIRQSFEGKQVGGITWEFIRKK